MCISWRGELTIRSWELKGKNIYDLNSNNLHLCHHLPFQVVPQRHFAFQVKSYNENDFEVWGKTNLLKRKHN